MFCLELLDRILLLFIENLWMIYFCTGGNFSFSIVKQQHHGRFPPGRVGVPLVTRIPYPTLFHTILFPCAHQENSQREKKPSTQKKQYSFQQLLFQLSYSAEKTKKQPDAGQQNSVKKAQEAASPKKSFKPSKCYRKINKKSAK